MSASDAAGRTADEGHAVMDGHAVVDGRPPAPRRPARGTAGARDTRPGGEVGRPDQADAADGASRNDTKYQLVRAAEHLFARRGIDGTHIRDINERAGQRNPSAVHYHFGSKKGLVTAIMMRHQEPVEREAGRRLDELAPLGPAATTRQLIEAMVRPLCRQLETPSGRDYLRIVPPVLQELDANLRLGVARPITTQSARLLDLLGARLAHLPEEVKRERLVAYTLVLTSILADRARQLADGRPAPLDAEQFIAHVLDVSEAVVTATSSIAPSPAGPSPVGPSPVAPSSTTPSAVPSSPTARA